MRKRRDAVNENAVALHVDSPLGEPREDPRQDDVLAFQHPCGEGVGVVARKHRDAGLRDDRPAVEFAGDEVNRRSVDFGTCRDSPARGCPALEDRAAGKGGC